VSSAPGRVLGLFDLTCLGVNAIVGTSIFLFPGLLAGHLGPASPAAFILTGLLLLPVALCYADAASRFDRPGGPYLYADAAFGEWAGYGVGWMCWSAEIFSWAAVASGLCAYLGYFSGFWTEPATVKVTAAGVILAMGALNYRGVRLGAWTTNVFTLAKLIPLSAFVLIGLFHVRAANFSPLAPFGWAPLGKACFLAFFAFSGFEVVPVPAGEVESPQKNVPRAVVASLCIAAVLYALIQFTAVGVLPTLAASERPLAAAAALFLGPLGASFIAVGAVLSTLGFNAGCALGGPRYLVALAQDRHLPRWFAFVHPKFGTPHRAVAATALLSVAAALAFDFSKLVDFSIVVICVQYAGTCVAAPIIARRRDAVGWLLPLCGIGATLWLGSQAGAGELVWALSLLALGYFLKVVFRNKT